MCDKSNHVTDHVMIYVSQVTSGTGHGDRDDGQHGGTGSDGEMSAGMPV